MSWSRLLGFGEGVLGDGLELNVGVGFESVVVASDLCGLALDGEPAREVDGGSALESDLVGGETGRSAVDVESQLAVVQGGGCDGKGHVLFAVGGVGLESFRGGGEGNEEEWGAVGFVACDGIDEAVGVEVAEAEGGGFGGGRLRRWGRWWGRVLSVVFSVTKMARFQPSGALLVMRMRSWPVMWVAAPVLWREFQVTW